MKDAIKNYLAKQVKDDAALAEKYDAGKLDGCIEHIMKQARLFLGGKNGAVRDEIVYKWARDFYLDDNPEENLKAAVKPAEKAPEKEEDMDKRQMTFDFGV